MSEQELRDLLHAEVDSVEVSGDLAFRAEKGWRRRRRNQGVVAGATLAVLAVIGGVVVALPRPAPAPVAAVSEEGCVELPAPAGAEPATTLAGWDYRGDPLLKAATQALAPPELRATARPLLGLRTLTETSPNTWVYALALRRPSGWYARIGSAEQPGGTARPIDDVEIPLPETGSVSAFVSLTGGFFAGSDGGALVALGPRGTDRIDYSGCRDGRTFTVGRAGDYLVLTTGPLLRAGRLTVRAGDRVVSTGRPQDVSMLLLAAPVSPDLSGYGAQLASTELRLIAGDRTRTVRLGPLPPANGSVYESGAAVLGVCAGRGSVLFEGTALLCDGRTHEIWTGVLASDGRPFEVTGVPDPATGRTSLRVALTVVAT